MPVTLVLLGTAFVLSARSYPTQIHIVRTTLSNLSDYEKNPLPGCVYFPVRVVLPGLPLIPGALYMDRSFERIRPHMR